jgi:hypothetical protein
MAQDGGHQHTDFMVIYATLSDPSQNVSAKLLKNHRLAYCQKRAVDITTLHQ